MKKIILSKIQTGVFLPFFLLMLFLLPAFIGLFHTGFPVTDDGSWMIIRFSAFYQALRHGQFPVRFLMRLNHGYGYPVADFLYPLFMYIGAPIHLLGFGFISTIKIILGGSLFLAGVFTFFWLCILFTPMAALVGAISYVLFPYYLFDVYQRGSVGEAVALSIVPFIFWQIEQRNYLLIAIGIALLIIAHNSLALLFFPVIILYMLLACRDVAMQRLYAISIFLGLGLSAFFWIPALYDKQFTVFDGTKVSDFSQYFITTKNVSLVEPQYIAVLLVIGVLYFLKKHAKIPLFFLFILCISLFFSLPLSAPLWNLLPLPQVLQFPFRFLSLAIVSTAFLSAYVMHTAKTLVKIIMLTVLCISMVYISAWQYLLPRQYQLYDDSYYATNQDSTTVKNEYMPTWVKETAFSSPKSAVEIIRGKGIITTVRTNNANKIQFSTHIAQSGILKINTIYFPGWEVFVNNHPQQIFYNNPQGVMEIFLRRGNYTIIAQFGETPIRKMADCISLVSIITGVLVLLMHKKRSSQAKK